jgi:2-keto-3-deoxy-L-rhamnonate aldolase RhmA
VSIVRTEGIDAVWIGLNDLTAALGLPGELEHSDVQRAVEHVIAVANSNKTPWCVLSADEDEIRRRQSEGGQLHLVTLNSIIVSRSRQLLSTRRPSVATPT